LAWAGSEAGEDEILDLKEMAAREAVKYVRDGMIVGLGSGSTASIAIKLIGELVREGWKLIGIPTSRASEVLGRSVGIRIGDLKDYPDVDVTIDGADEVDPKLNLVKGLGGALVREKIVAASTRTEVIVVDQSKLVDFICQKAPLPVEILQFGHQATMKKLERFGCTPAVRRSNGDVFVTDNGNIMADCRFTRINDPAKMEWELNLVPGVVDNGLFVGLAHVVIVSSKDGIRTMTKDQATTSRAP
jgi:ribose 5-phosphate isomerase A